MPTSAHSTSDLLDTAERRAFVLRLRKMGGTYAEISSAATEKFGIDALPRGWDERYAYKDVARELQKLRTEVADAAEDVRALELQRLDDLLKSVWMLALGKQETKTTPAVAPDYDAFDRVLKLMERRAKLTGLDAPTQQQLTVL